MASTGEPPSSLSRPGLLRRALRILRPSYEHGPLSATLLLMTAVLLSRVVGYVREAYIAYAFGAGLQTDAYVAAFTLPDWLNYLVAGGTASITFISIFTRYLAQKREEEAQKAFSVIITVMTLVLGVGIVLVEVFTPALERLIFPDFAPEQLQLCVRLTRILLPAQVFFYVGGVVAAVLLSRRLFLFPAFGPLLYNISIILGGVLFSQRLGIASLAYGALLGACLGPFLINAFGAARTGLRYRPSLAVSDPAFREWVRLSIPLMLGVSLVTADDWILRFFASGSVGDIARLNYAKRLFAVPLAVLGQAVGQASLPFFARLYGEKRLGEFARTVSDSVYRIAAASLLASAWMAAAALPVIDLVYRRGQFHFQDSQTTALYFFWFALSLGFWSAQGLYARGFYAAGDTLTPMVASTVITLASLPVYSLLFDRFGTVGLAMASGAGIAANTMVMAVLLHRRALVPLGIMRWKQLIKALGVAAAAGLLAGKAAGVVVIDGSYTADFLAVSAATVVWAAVLLAGLWMTRSDLPGELRRRRRVAYPGAAEKQAEDMTAGIEP
jgi:putative peptidoglycan lipid II flippase